MDFADMVKLGILRWGDHPGLLGHTQINHKGPYKREAGGSEIKYGYETKNVKPLENEKSNK